MDVKLLTEKARLQEIYDLRVAAYEHSPYSKFINKDTYPKGYFDKLDSLGTTYHWIVEKNEQIIGSVRIALINNLGDMDEPLRGLVLPEERPFAYCGRTVVHPDFRKTRAMFQLDRVIMEFFRENTWVKFALCYVVPERIKAVKRMGFRHIGDIEYDWGNQNKTNLAAFVLERKHH